MTKMAGEKRSTLPVSAAVVDIRKAYAKMSKLYTPLEGIFEKKLREKGLELLSVKKDEAVLEIGFGTGYSLRKVAGSVGETGKAHGIDLTLEMLKITRKRLEKAGLEERVDLCEGDARNLPYYSDTFDAVYMAATLELFDTPDIPKVLEEIKRVLKPEGRLVVVSLSKEGRENSNFLRFYEWLHKKSPKYISCRPIYVEDSIKEAGYRIVKKDEYILGRLVPWKTVVATPP